MCHIVWNGCHVSSRQSCKLQGQALALASGGFKASMESLGLGLVDLGLGLGLDLVRISLGLGLVAQALALNDLTLGGGEFNILSSMFRTFCMVVRSIARGNFSF